MKGVLIKNWYFYILGLVLIYGLKHYYSVAGAEELNWILAPTAWWVEVFSGNTFERVSNIGYVNNASEFIIASSCAGINFLIISFSTLLYSFLHRLDSVKKKLLWFLFAMVAAYLFTIGVNSLRIIFSMVLFHADIYGGLITPDRVHRIEGTVVYIVSLFTIFMTTEKLMKNFSPSILKPRSTLKLHESSMTSLIRTCSAPLFWYFLITLGIPLINKAYKKEPYKFLEHILEVASISLIIVVILFALINGQRQIKKSFMTRTK